MKSISERLLNLFLIAITFTHLITITNSSIEILIAYAIGIAFFASIKTKYLFYAILFVAPLENFFKISAHSISLMTIIIIIGFSIIALKNLNHIGRKNIFFSFIFIIVMLIRTLFDDSANNGVLFRLLLNFNIIIIMLNASKDEFKSIIEDGIEYYIKGVLALSVIYIYKGITEYGIIEIFTRRLYGYNNDDPNFTASYICIAIAIIIVKYIAKEQKFYMLISCVFLLFTGLLTQSRGFVIGLIPVCIFFAEILFKCHGKIKILLPLLAVTIFFILEKDYIEELVNHIIYRFVNDDEISTGRFVIWKEYITYMKNHPTKFLIGNIRLENDYHRSHNLLLGAISEEGFLVTLIEIAYYFSIGKEMITHINKEKCTVISSALLVYMFINASLINVFFYTIIIVFVL